jgi:hypothetical protein
VDTFLTSSFGTFVMTLWNGVLSTPSWQNFTYLAYGWALACGRQTITTYLWGSGAAQVKHFSRYYAFLGQALYQRRFHLWARVIRCGASLVPVDAVIEVRLDDATMKKTGRHIQGAAHYRNGAGTARQEYRTLWGINLVWAIMRIPLPLWPGHHLSLPIGLELYLKETLANKLKVPYRSPHRRPRRDYPSHPRHTRGDRWRLCHPSLLTCPAPQRRGGGTFLTHGQTVSTAVPAWPKPAWGAAQKRPADWLAQNFGHPFACVAPAPAGSRGLHPIVGGDMAQCVTRTAYTDRGGLAATPCRQHNIHRQKSFWTSQVP